MIAVDGHPGRGGGGRHEEFDVCIVGAGPAGITVARELAGSRLRVAVLESGGLEQDEESRSRSDGELGGRPYEPLPVTRARAFGGTSVLWPRDGGLRSRPLDPIDFEARAGVPDSGWPFGASDLKGFYERAHEAADLGPLGYAPENWADPARTPTIALDGTPVRTVVFRFGRSVDVFRRRRSELEGAANVTFFLRTTAERILCDDEPGRVSRIGVVGPDGHRWDVRARVFVLAAGGLENPRLLLLSRDAHGKGLGNHHDLVGRYFQEHLRITTGYVVPEDPALVGRLAFYRRHAVKGLEAMGALGLAPEVVRAEGLLNTAVYLRPSRELRARDAFRSLATLKEAMQGSPGARADRPVRHLGRLIAHPLDAAATLGRVAVRRNGPRILQLGFQTEQAPNPSSRVTLGERRDHLGLPVARLEWRLNELDLRSVRQVQEILDRAFRARGLGRVVQMLGEERPPAPVGGFRHHIGTTRMHDSPRHGVVDPDGRVHGTSNLFVAGSSVFPTGGYANPTLTVVALALRLADRLRRLSSLDVEPVPTGVEAER